MGQQRGNSDYTRRSSRMPDIPTPWWREKEPPLPFQKRANGVTTGAFAVALQTMDGHEIRPMATESSLDVSQPGDTGNQSSAAAHRPVAVADSDVPYPMPPAQVLRASYKWLAT